MNQIIIEGDLNKPAVIFIHGLGMDKRIWTNPDESRIIGGRFPVSVLLPPDNESGLFSGKAFDFPGGLSLLAASQGLKTLYHDLSSQGFTVITWSQKNSSSETDVAIDELRKVLQLYKEFCRKGIILIGHSRGGLVARRYLELREQEILMIITLGSPHRGTTLALWGRFIFPLTKLLKKVLPKSQSDPMTSTFNKLSDFLPGQALKEILPDSPFFKSLENNRVGKTIYLTVSGTRPTLLTLYRTSPASENSKEKKFTPFFSLPDILEKIIPFKILPEEMKQGKGDGLVSLESSRLSWANENYTFEVNHAGILFNMEVRRTVLDFIAHNL